jgi:hypothetical protein
MYAMSRATFLALAGNTFDTSAGLVAVGVPVVPRLGEVAELLKGLSVAVPPRLPYPTVG